ncbi:MAG: replication factor C small subunit [Candidatus Aenigmatarchaeota archaeon]|nr:MAG: replication factor C small subunit [Candidatus Aenigmarchaeota archaeon]
MTGIEVWTEKYRPEKLDEVINQKHVVERLRVWVKQGNVPNMLFAGSAGVGKTTIALCLARELYGENWRQNFQETNASDERGINVVRGRIKDFAKMKPLGADFKIIFLDESDSLTPEAQQALRRTIESFSGVCRFILSANYSSRIIEPIQSRCAVFRLRGMTEGDAKEYLNRIIKGEKLKADANALKAIYEISGGDLRKATNLLQASAALGKITPKSVYEVAAQANPSDVLEMINLALSGKFTDARKKLHDLLINQGLSGEDIIREMHRQVLNLKIPEKNKLNLVEKIGEFEFRLNQGGSEDIQIEALLTHFLKAKK